MNGYQVCRHVLDSRGIEGVQPGGLVTLGIGPEHAAMQAAEDMSRTLGGILHVMNPCGMNVASFENGTRL
jgi:hypothetical protein